VELVWKPPNLQKELGLRESHVARSRCRRAPALLAGEVARPDVRLYVGVMGSDDINERRSAKNKLQGRVLFQRVSPLEEGFTGGRLTHENMLPYPRMPDGVRKTWHGARASDLLSERWDASRL
jgi:hypothetical protein